MLNIDDTIAAISTAAVPVGTAGRSVIRISGPDTFNILPNVLTAERPFQKNQIHRCSIRLDDLIIDGLLYAFFQPHSYTGQDLAELHLDTCSAAVEAILAKLYRYARPALPGEFTQRAFLNGRMDLTQAEAVAQIVTAANATQLAAAERLLHGRFSNTIGHLREQIIELLGHLEAGLDFTEEDIEFISKENALNEIIFIQRQLADLLEGSIRCERMIDMDSVGLAGRPNAGKSSLLNALLGQTRSIVSDTHATTRDVLTGLLQLENIDCILFDCAGLLSKNEQTTTIDQLSHEASMAALSTAAVVLFCIDATKNTFEAEQQMLQHINAETVIYIMTKVDTLSTEQRSQQQTTLETLFNNKFLSTSVKTSEGLQSLKQRIQAELLRHRAADTEYENRHMINQRHEQRLAEAIELLRESAEEINIDSVETAAMLLRQSYTLLGGLETEDISETILDGIFSRFCIGK